METFKEAIGTSSRGKLFVFEGLDKAGKSTQCSKLVENLRVKGYKVEHKRFPDRSTAIGKSIDAYLKGQSQQDDHAIHLLFSANRWEAAKSIRDNLENGINVVIDRYYYSGCVYSAAKDNPNLDLSWARKCDEGLPRPDRCMFLEISPEKAAERGGWGHERYEKKDMQNRVRDLFNALRTYFPEKEDFAVFDGGLPLEQVADMVLQEAERVIHDVDSRQLPLRRMTAW